ELFRSLRQADARRAEVVARRNKLTAGLQAAEAELARILEGRDETVAAIRVAESALEAANLELETGQAKPRPMLDASARDTAYATVERHREVEVQRRLELETMRERARSSAQARDALIE